MMRAMRTVSGLIAAHGATAMAALRRISGRQQACMGRTACRHMLTRRHSFPARCITRLVRIGIGRGSSAIGTVHCRAAGRIQIALIGATTGACPRVAARVLRGMNVQARKAEEVVAMPQRH